MAAEPAMHIQEESPLPANPLEGWEEDYASAVLHLAWDRHATTQERTLLFAFVELLPAEIPPPIDDYAPKTPRSSHRLGGESKHHVYVRHAVVTARQALDWYLACRVGVAVLPDDDGTIPADASKAKRLKLADLGEEPPWPTLISASDDSDVLPFCPQWIHCPRTHHLLPLVDFDRDQLWSAEEQEEARRWLKDRLHFDLEEYPEYWGSVHLIAPNPVYREMDIRLQPREPPVQSVFVRFQPRAGKAVDGLELSFQEKEPWGMITSRRLRVRSSLMRIHFPRGAIISSLAVSDPARGFLHVSNRAMGFLGGISISHRIGQRLKIEGPESLYEVTRSGKPTILTVGSTQKVDSAQSRMRSAQLVRRRRHAAEAQQQRWFKDQKDEAQALLRSLLNEADHDVLLIDPYFGAEELSGLLAVGREDIPIRILSSAEILKEEVSKTDGREKGAQLLDVLQQLRSHERMNPFEIRVMTGKRPAIHDRFLAIDKRIWLLGSSLNEFGSRGTMMLALPDPDAVRDDLVKAWKDAEDLETWIARRDESRQKARGEIT